MNRAFGFFMPSFKKSRECHPFIEILVVILQADFIVIMNKKEASSTSSTASLYPYQKRLVAQISDRLRDLNPGENLLFQLPTGGGKTIIFSEITRKFIAEKKTRVLILTHRLELLGQTSNVLNGLDVNTMVINAQVREIEDQSQYECFVAMVETLNNRLLENEYYLEDIGLVIVDEAHYNSFRKIFQYFKDVNILGVTATPLSSNKNLPLNNNYDQLITGESIADLIEHGYLCKATTYSYSVNLRALTVGISGDFTVSSSERIYSRNHMQDILINAYEEKAKGKKTLIFNAGIATSLKVYELFKAHGYHNIRHLDSTFADAERKAILAWFKSTPGAVLTSVGILTTGFDEPSVESIILNRATRSLTLYHQMIGRGSRVLPDKKHFSIIDLGNNALRLGYWQDYIDWHDVFRSPMKYIERDFEQEIENRDYVMPEDVKEQFANSDHDAGFDVKEIYKHCLQTGIKTKKVIDESIENHLEMILENTLEYHQSLELLALLKDEIKHRVKVYTKCINGTENYATWLAETYIQKMKYRLWLNLSALIDD